jgi:hypothetical protein
VGVKIQTGGKAVFWTWVFNDDRNIQNSGNRNGMRITANRRYVQGLSPVRLDERMRYSVNEKPTTDN